MYPYQQLYTLKWPQSPPSGLAAPPANTDPPLEPPGKDHSLPLPSPPLGAEPQVAGMKQISTLMYSFSLMNWQGIT